jgi:hypothetical protein
MKSVFYYFLEWWSYFISPEEWILKYNAQQQQREYYFFRFTNSALNAEAAEQFS